MATKPEQFFAIYEAAKRKVESGTFSIHEQALVYAWDTAKTQLIRAQAAEQQAAVLQKKVRESAFNDDIMKTKIAMLEGVMPEGLGEDIEFSFVQH